VTETPHGFGDEAAEMADETEVEAPLEGASAPADHVDPDQPDTSGVDNWVEEGGPLEPSDVEELEQVGSADVRVAELTADLQRLQAEFLNYKRRVERDRAVVAENATYRVLVPIIDVLDTVDRAREHGDLDAGFAAVADQLERVVTGLGLTKFGTPGEPFDPNLHEALSHIGEDPEVEVTTCKVVAKAGYRIGERVVRAAQVLVVDPA
jgi:molecular chaperone GrpE